MRRGGAEVGYPLVIKASAGGGGKGMRVVCDEAEVEDAYLEASREAAADFGDGSVYVEKYLEEAQARRGAGARRFARYQGRLPGAGLLHPAPLPEARRGVPGAGSAAGVREELASAALYPGRLAGLRGGRDRRVRLLGRRVLLYRDEHAAAGRAPCDRDGERG